MPKPLFPDEFRMDAFLEYRRERYGDPGTLFQELLGDAFFLSHGASKVKLSSTAGADGGVDIYVESEIEAGEKNRWGLEGPYIVECKKVDPGPGLRDRIFGGWRKVKGRLERASRDGWTGHHVLWKEARGYLYCLSCGVSAPAIEHQLQQEIEGFFKDLSEPAAIETVKVVFWPNLRRWLDRIPDLAAYWLTQPSSPLLTNQQYRETFLGLRNYLEESPFVSPPLGHALHPETLLEKVEERSEQSRGVLLEGVGGIGKTRLLYEVAKLAETKGWRVLHLPLHEPVDLEELGDEVLEDSRRTLLVLDYLFNMSWIKLGWLRRLLRERKGSGQGRLALLASRRPYVGSRAGHEVDRIFETVELEPEADHCRQVVQALLESATPQVVEHFGFEQLLRYCGDRPLLALLIASDLQERLDKGHAIPNLDRLSDPPGRGDSELARWLIRRLTEDELLLEAKDPLDFPNPQPPLIASAVAFAVAPMAAVWLEGALDLSSELLRVRYPEPRDQVRVRAVLRRLQQIGWLEARDGYIEAVHDSVVDEVLNTVLRPEEGVVDPALEAILASCGARWEVFESVWTALRRLWGLLDSEAHQELQEALGHELGKQVETLGHRLADGGGQAGEAMVSVLEDEPFRGLLLPHWRALSTPYLAHSQAWEAPNSEEEERAWRKRLERRWTGERDLLVRVLDILPPGNNEEIEPVLSSALDWLEGRGDRSEGFVKADQRLLIQLLANTNEGSREASRVRRLSLAWLGSSVGEEQQALCRTPQAQGVLTVLAGRADLAREELDELLRHTLTWHEHLGETLESGGILALLLLRKDLGALRGKLEAAAVNWLSRHRQEREAVGVLRALLDRQNPRWPGWQKLVNSALEWLGNHIRRLESGPLLWSLAQHIVPGEVEDHRQVEEGIKSWLELHGKRLEAFHLLQGLLDPEVPYNLPNVEDYAVSWVQEHAKQWRGCLLLARLLERVEAPFQEGTSVRVMELALEAADSFSKVFETLRLLEALASSHQVTGELLETVAFSWLERFGDQPEAGRLLWELLRGNQVPLEKVAAWALRWLEEGHRQRETLEILGETSIEEALSSSSARRWLEQKSQVTLRSEVILQKLLAEVVEDSELAREVVERAWIWFQDHGNRPGPEIEGFALQLYSRPELPKERSKTLLAYLVFRNMARLETEDTGSRGPD